MGKSSRLWRDYCEKRSKGLDTVLIKVSITPSTGRNWDVRRCPPVKKLRGPSERRRS